MNRDVEVLVLAALERGHAHAGELIGRLPEQVEIDTPELFPLLQRLERAGLVRHRRAGRHRVYALTARGRSVAREQRGLWRIIARAVSRLATA